MSHHFDSPTAIADGRLNACDLFAFPAGEDRSVLILTVNPDAGRSSPTTLRPDALYEFVIAGDGGTTEDVAFRFRFEAPDPDGRQQFQVVRAVGEGSRSGFEGESLGAGVVGETVELTDGARAWVGLAADPFFADGAALGQFLQNAHDGRYTPEVFTAAPSNLFDGRNVTGLVLELPDTALESRPLAVWARISLYGHAPQQQVSRIGQPMLRPLFFPVPGPATEALNAGRPGTDLSEHSGTVSATAATIARLAGRPDPDGQAADVTAAFLPDVLRYQPGRPAGFALDHHDTAGVGNGRSLTDDAFRISVDRLTGGPVAPAGTPSKARGEFPYLADPDHSDRPALADLFGLREHRPEQAPASGPAE